MASKYKDPFAERFSLVGDDYVPRIIGGSFGEVGTLKTSFWLSGPSPIWVASTDDGLEGVAQQFRKKGKQIYEEKYDASTDGQDQDGAIEIRDKIIEDTFYAIDNGIRTVLWDKETQIYEILKYAEFGAPSDVPSNYYPLFQKYRKLFSRIKASTINFGVIQGMKTPWVSTVKASGKVGGKASAERVRRGMPEIEEMVNINIEHIMRLNEEKEPEFFLKIGKVRADKDVADALQYKEFPYMEFADLATEMFPDTTAEDWE